ncbi:hypothetical protein ACFE04_009045 [Oxalis oulophora]
MNLCLKFSLVLFIIAFDSSTYAAPFFKVFRRAHIHIINHLDRPVYVNCFTLGYDYGLQYLPEDTTYDVPFITHYWPSAKYFCEIEDVRKKQQSTFTAYNLWDNRLLDDYCGSFRVCEWVLKDGGIWIHNVKNGKYTFGSKWVHDPWAHMNPSNNIAPDQAIQN